MSVIFEIFEGLVATNSPADYVFKHPVLLSSAWHAVLSNNLTTPKQEETLARLIYVTHAMQDDPQKYPIGPGPIERIYGQAKRGEITKEQALELAVAPAAYSLLSPFYVRLLSINAERRAQQSDWQTGVAIEQLILSALDSRRGQIEVDQDEMDFIAVIHWLDIVSRAVWEVPDSSLFHDALKRGLRLAAVINDPGDLYSPAEILHRLGILHLDPYVYARQSENYEQQWRLWQERFDQQRNRDMRGMTADADRIPRAEVALPEAAKFLRQAAPHRSGIHRGLTLKALVQALVWQRAVGLTPDSSEVEEVANEALSLLPSQGHEAARVEIENLLRWNGNDQRHQQSTDSATLENARRMLLQPLDEWVARNAPQEVIQLFMQTARAVSTHPNLALKLWFVVASIIPGQEEQLKSTYYTAGRNLVQLAFPPKDLPAQGQRLAARVAAVQALGHDSYTTAAMIFSLATHSGATNEESSGIKVLDYAAGLDTKFAQDFEALILYTRSVLRHDAAVTALENHQSGEAAGLYILSAYDLLAIQQPQMALHMFEDALDLTIGGDARAIQSVVAFIADVAVRLEQQLGDLVTYKLQVVCRELLSRIIQPGGPINPVLLLFLWQAAKGNAFSRALASGARLAWLETADAQRMEENIRKLAAHVTPQPWGLFDDSQLLTSYVSSGEQHGGSTAGEQLGNLQITFDTAVNRQLVMRDVPAESWFLTDTTLQAALGSSTVLLVQYIGSVPSGSLAIFTLFATRETLGMTVGTLPDLFSGTVVYEGQEGSGGRIVSSLFAPFVESLRKSVQEEPGPRIASDEALNILRGEMGDFFGGGLAEKLETFRNAGKNHLCICPHGPFHFFPFHLFGDEDHPLTQQWNVTYLPNLRLLDPSRTAAKRTQDLIVIGLDFKEGNTRGLPPLSGPQAEAEEIAHTTGCPSITGPAVSRSSVLDALQSYGRIHIATHGDLEVSTPAFQCLYLSPHAGGDLLNAYEILRLDLRGVDLVTLSACETALGRFDLGDNLRGIPASLLVAGVSTIIGTLWPVETNTAQTFFISFYSHLQGGVTKGEAFHAAQIDTRTQYHQYRDWGAFYLIGAVA